MANPKTPRGAEGFRPQFAPLAALAADERARALLRKRAEELARPEEDTAPVVLAPYLHFRLGRSEEYGVPGASVQEAVTVGAIARVPCAPPSVLGVINRRGQMLPVLDLCRFFGLEADVREEDSALDIVVVGAAGFMVGLRVDELLGMSAYAPDALSSGLPSQGWLERSHVLGLLEGRITLLNIERVLTDLCGHADGLNE
jgi:purine-binding chemotaxis protein CheW